MSIWGGHGDPPIPAWKLWARTEEPAGYSPWSSKELTQLKGLSTHEPYVHVLVFGTHECYLLWQKETFRCPEVGGS